MRPMRKYNVLLFAFPDSPPLDLAAADLVVEAMTYPKFLRASDLVLKPELDAVLISAGQKSVRCAIRLVEDLRSIHSVPCILVTSSSSEDLAIDSLNSGVSLYFKHPVSAASIYGELAKLVDRGVHNCGAAPAIPLHGTERLLGCSKSVCELREYIGRISWCHSNVLITGETGTGKELVAELIHSNSPRRLNAFVCLNSAAIPDTLLESELFGHERGAFTGAIAAHRGKMALAHKGTLFLDEIGDLGTSAQAKLLRAIDGKAVYRLGGEKEFAFDVRILAATNQDLDTARQQNRFRSDLYYRLNVVRIQLPPLRDRREDIPILLSHYIGHFNSSLGSRITGFTQDALSQLMFYEWPGNIRELKNVVEAIFASAPSRPADAMELPPYVRKYLSAPQKPAERDALLSALLATNWNKTQAADRLHWSRTTVYRKIVTYNIVRPAESLPA